MSIGKKIEGIKEHNTRVRNYVSGVVSGGTNYASSLVKKAEESVKEKRAKFVRKKHELKTLKKKRK